MPVGNRPGDLLCTACRELPSLAAWLAVKLRAPMRPENIEAGEHKASIAVWELVSPLVIGRRAKVKVGAKCSAGCQLTDHQIEIHDGAGETVTRAGLGATPWPGTSGLYWTDIEFRVPAGAGTHTFSAALEHGDAQSEFSFIAVEPPEHSLTIHIQDKATNEPITEVEIRLGVYRSISDAHGLATIEVPKGNYPLTVWKLGYELFSTELSVNNTATMDVEIAVEPEPAQPYWM